MPGALRFPALQSAPRRALLPTALFLFLSGLANVAWARPAPGRPSHPRIILILHEGLDAEYLFGHGYRGPLAPFLPRAGTALLNPAVPRPHTSASVYMSVGAGRRLHGDDGAGFPVLATGQVEGDAVPVVYRRRTGLDPLRAAALHLGIAPLRRTAGDGVGTLGDACGAAGLTIGFLAVTPMTHPSLTGETSLGTASLVAIDSAGRVAVAETSRGETFREAVARCLALLRLTDVLVVKLEDEASLRTTPTGERLAAALLPRLDLERNTLILCSPVPHSLAGPDAARWDRLPPLLAWGSGFRPGPLMSATTRTAGLVANVDVTPSIMASLGLALPSDLDGHPMRSAGAAGPKALLGLARLVRLHQVLQIPLYVGFGAFATLALVVSYCAVRCRWTGVRLRAAQMLALLAISVPAALLLVPLFQPTTAALYVLAVVLASAAMAGAAMLLSRWYPPPIRSALLLLTLLLGGDLFLGGTAIARSILSDFPMTGMRFYGIGNEYMALAVAGLIAAVGWKGRESSAGRPVWLIAVGLTTVAIIGHPALGANFGGALTAAAGFTVAWMVAAGVRLSGHRLALLAGGLVLLGSGLLAVDALRLQAARSHMGDLGHRMATEGPAVLFSVAGRKLGMNWRILVSPWFLFSLAVVAFASAVCYHGFGAAARALMARRRDLRAVASGIVAAGVVGLFAKDSGVVVAAYVACVLFAFVVGAVLEDVGRRGEETS